MGTRIVLVGEHTPVTARLAEILRAGGFVVEYYESEAVRGALPDVLSADTVLIVGVEVAENLSEDSILNLPSGGFLLFDPRCVGANAKPPSLLHAGMSPEEIIATVNDIVFSDRAERKSARIRINVFVDYEHEGKEHASMLQDISESGVFIGTLAPPPVGSRLTLRFSLNSDDAIVAEGRVVYRIMCDLDRKIIAHPAASGRKIIALPGAGIVFETISDADRQTIRNFIKQQR